MSTGAATDPRLRDVADQAQTRFAALEEQAQSPAARIALAASVLRWAAATFGQGLTVASSMGDEALVHLVGTTIPDTDVFFLDTGYHFAETLGTRDAYAAMLPIRLRTILPRLTVAEQDAAHGSALHDRDPDTCCAMRKVEPLNRALTGYAAWVTGMRRVDATTRADVALVEWDHKRQMVKINPTAGWSDDDLHGYVEEHHVFLHPLRDEGYASIGCAPCTRPVAPGEDPRAGRWAGQNKTECGLHT